MPEQIGVPGGDVSSLLVAGVCCLARLDLCGCGSRPPQVVSAAPGSSGSFTFTGSISGTLKVTPLLQPGNQPSCTISPSQSGTDVVVWDNAKLKEGGKVETIPIVNVEIEVSKFGHSYSMKPDTSGTQLGAVYLSTNAPYQRLAKSGTVSTNKDGTSGSVDGTLSAGTAHAGSVVVKGSWAGCGKLT